MKNPYIYVCPYKCQILFSQFSIIFPIGFLTVFNIYKILIYNVLVSYINISTAYINNIKLKNIKYICNYLFDVGFMAGDFDPHQIEGKDKDLDGIIRPQDLQGFTGQDKIISNLRIFVQAAKLRGESLDHVLFHGPTGLGKTTLAHIIANELGVNMKVTSGPILDKPGDLAGLLTSLEEGDVLFIDEIHRLSPVVEEYLYSAMEDFVIDIMIDKGPGARSVRISLNPFTLVGATTRSGLLTSPLRARFGIKCALEYYDTQNLVNIVKRSSSILKVDISDEAAYEVALRSRGTPRIANSLLRRVRDFAQVIGSGDIDIKIARYALDALNIDKRGLDSIDNKILKTIITKFKGGPVGANTIATAVGEDQGTLEEVYEPFLIKEGFIIRTPRGREVTELAYRHLGLEMGESGENLLF